MLFFVLTAFVVATTILSTAYSNRGELAAAWNVDEEKLKQDINVTVVVLPIMAAFIGQIITGQRYADKWKICEYVRERAKRSDAKRSEATEELSTRCSSRRKSSRQGTLLFYSGCTGEASAKEKLPARCSLQRARERSGRK
jgi:hypothetical protein